MIGHALQWARLSEGAFDPAIGRVVELWDVTHRHAPPPDQGVRRLAGRQLYRAVELGLERGQHAVRFATDDVHLDLGGIAKGYGVDRAVTPGSRRYRRNGRGIGLRHRDVGRL